MKRKGIIAGIAMVLCGIAATVIFFGANQGSVREPARPETNRIPPLLKSKCLRDFTLTATEKGRSSTVHTFTAKDRLLKIEVILGVEKETADALLSDGIMGLEALYANALAPYPGDISNTVVGDARFRPKFFRQQAGQTTYSYYLLFANERMGYGASTADAVKFKSLIGWVYCETSRDFYKVKYFVPLETDAPSMEEIFLALTCQ